MQDRLGRIIDANINRSAEGLRILEDISRFMLNNKVLSHKLKALRHRLIIDAGKYGLELLDQRNVIEDLNSKIYEKASRQDINSIISANARRIQEGLRVLEEMAKLPDLKNTVPSAGYKSKRFDVYHIERNLVSEVLKLDKIERIKGLYFILDMAFIKDKKFIDIAKQTIRGGAKIIQLRDKQHIESKKLLSIAKELKQICSLNDAIFIVNDYLDIALASGADGIHLGPTDLPVKEARRLLPIDRIIGYSAKNIEDARQAKKDGADYIAVGSVFPTSTKADINVVGLGALRKIKKSLDMPVVAIGGINRSNINRVFSSGADAAAVISVIMLSKDVEQATIDLITSIQGAK